MMKGDSRIRLVVSGVAILFLITTIGCSAHISSGVKSRKCSAREVDAIVRAYEEIWHSFYDVENLSKMLVVKPVLHDHEGGVRFCSYFDRQTRCLYDGIRLYLDEEAYSVWKDRSEKLLEEVGANEFAVDERGNQCRVVGEKSYRFPLPIEERLLDFDRRVDENWQERFVIRANVFIKDDVKVASVLIPDFKFYMRGGMRASLPFTHLSKSQDVASLSSGCAQDSPASAFANVVFAGVDFDSDRFEYVDYEYEIQKGYNPRNFAEVGGGAELVVSNILANMVSVLGSRSFVSKYEVTQQEWTELMGFNPSQNVSPRNPVENVDYFDCRLFIDVLNSFSSVRSARLRFRLPSYEEWMAACFCDSNWGSRIDNLAGCCEAKGWLASNSEGRTHEVGLKEPNEFGLFDMIGNVSEYTSDTDDLYYRYAVGGSFKSGSDWHCESPVIPCYEKYEACGLRLFAEETP